MINKYSAMGAVASWLIVSMFYGHLLPVLSGPTIIAAVVGTIGGTIVGAMIEGGDSE